MSQGFARNVVYSLGEQFNSTITGTFTASTKPMRLPMEYSGTITGVRFVCNTAPTGAEAICDVLKTGSSSLWTAQASQPNIAVSTFDSGVHAPQQNDTFVAGDYYKVAIDQIGSTIAGADGTVTIFVERLEATTTIQQAFAVGIPGTFAVASGTIRIPMEFDGEVVSVRFVCNTSPTGATAICDVEKNGSDSLWSTTPSNRPTIAISGNDSGAVAPEDDFTFVAGDWFHVDLDQVGSTVAGADGTVLILVRRI